MRIFLLSIGLLIEVLFSTTLFCQVGINISNPTGVFHIDGMNNTVSQNIITDDVVVDAIGNIGVGIISPAAALDVRGNNNIDPFILEDGTHNPGRVLTAINALGDANWSVRGGSRVLIGTVRTGAQMGDMTTNDVHQEVVSTRITIPAGQGLGGYWMIVGKVTTVLSDYLPATISVVGGVSSLTGRDYSTWLYLHRYTGGTLGDVLMSMGAPHAMNDDVKYATPLLYGIFEFREADLPQTLTLAVSRGSTGIDGTTFTLSETLGMGYFYAIRLGAN